MARAERDPERGFTMVELMVVLGIMIIVAALIIPTIGGLMRSSKLTSSANTCAAMMRAARSMAIASSQVYCFEFDAGTDPALVGVYDDSPTAVHPKGQPHTEARMEHDIGLSSPNAIRLEFQPDGSARLDGQVVPIVAYTVELSAEGGKKRTVSVKGHTGLVRVYNGQ